MTDELLLPTPLVTIKVFEHWYMTPKSQYLQERQHGIQDQAKRQHDPGLDMTVCHVSEHTDHTRGGQRLHRQQAAIALS